MLEVLLADAFSECLGPSSGPDILLFKKFRESRSTLTHQQLSDVEKLQKTPKVAVSDSLKAFISHQLSQTHAREDYKEFLILAGLLVDQASQLQLESRVLSTKRSGWQRPFTL